MYRGTYRIYRRLIMTVLNIKSYKLQYQATTQGYDDVKGDYHPGESYWCGDIECDAVPAGKANERIFEDGSVKKYSFTIYMKSNSRVFCVGEKVRLLRLGEVYECEVKGFMPYQHQHKMWIG